METISMLSMILFAFLILSLVVNIILFLFLKQTQKSFEALKSNFETLQGNFEALQSIESFEDQLLIRLIAISESIVDDVNKFFSESLIASIPEIQNLMMYVRRMRDLYRTQIREYNANNKYRNRIIISEFTEEEKQEQQA